MSAAQHTAGPWHRNIKPATKYVTVWAGRSTHVAKIVTQGIGVSECEANLDLIAAAPELLAALQEARDGLRWYQDSFPQATDGSDDEAMARIDAAITKATGSAA